MRVGIDFRILTVGPSAATRGMPRYTQQQLREVLAAGSDDEFLLFCDPRADRSLILPEILSAPNVSVRLVPEAVTVDVHDDAGMLAKAEVFESWLGAQNVDLYHATTPFFLDQLLVGQHDTCPYVATVYDLIPLIYPAQYLASPKLRQLYLLAATMVRRATRLLAISEAARGDAGRYLGFPADRIDVASPIAEPFFQPMAASDVEAALGPLRRRLGLAGPFVLSVSDLHFTKNLETLLRAYAQLPPATRARLPLVVACHLSKEHTAYLNALAGQLGVGGQVRTTGLVSDRALAALYNAARFVVHPSRFEGFGLPVLEAMQCGTPVITTTASSLPEVAGDAAMLVDPDDAPALAEAMRVLDGDPDLAGAMRVRGLARAATYTGAALAEATVRGYSRAVAAPDGDARRGRLRVAVWTPLPPLQSGIADYSDALVAELDARCEVELFVDDNYLPALPTLLAYPVRNYRAFDRLAGGFDAVIYQLGASTFHLYMAEPMRRHPGIVVLHDLVWSHLLHHRWAEQGDLDGFRRELLELEGAEAVAEYDALDRSDHRRWADLLRAFLNRHLMLGHVVADSRAQIVHYPSAVAELTERYPGAQATFVRMGVPDPFDGRVERRRPAAASEARSRLGIGAATFVVGVFGLVDGAKRVEATVAAFAEVAATQVESLLLVVGPVLDPAYVATLRDVAERREVSDRVRVTGYVAADDFDDHMAATDVVVNLRVPSKKQMSATVLRAAAAGKPVIVTDLPEWAFLPSTFCLRVATGTSEVDELARHLVELAGDRLLRSRLGAAASAYHRDQAGMARMAAGYVDVLERLEDRSFDVASGTSDSQTAVPLQRSTADVNLNKVCDIEDFSDPDLAAVMRDVFSYKLAHMPPSYPQGSEYRKDWEIAMAVRALRDGGVLRPDAVVLGVGAGSEDTSFYLTRHVGRVVATDRYLSAGSWGQVASPAMLVDPASVAPYDFDRSRLVVQHMDGRHLRFDDDTFDGIFSSGSIEHFGDLENIAAAAYEMGRVLKPGGVLSLSTELLLSGPPGGMGMPGTVLFSPDDLRRYLIEASGLELMDAPQLEVSQPTLTGQRDLARAISERLGRTGGDHGQSSWPGDPGLELPHLVVVCDGYVFGSVHLALRKGVRHPAAPNQWARPWAELIQEIEDDDRAVLEGPAEPPVAVSEPARAPEPRSAPVPLPVSWAGMETLAEGVRRAVEERRQAVGSGVAQILAMHAQVDSIVAAVRGAEALAASCRTEVDAVLRRLAPLAGNVDALAFDVPKRTPGARTDRHGPGRRWCPVTLPNGLRFGVMVDPGMADDITGALLEGGGALDWTAVMLMLAMVRPGDVVLDLGAYLGTFTLAAAAAGCTVVALEASPVNAALLRASVGRNGFDGVHVVNAAASDAPGPVALRAEGPFGYIGGTTPEGRQSTDLVVPAITVDALLDEVAPGRVALVKMDIEGSEIRALRGMTGLLAPDDAPPVLFESNGHTLALCSARPAGLLDEIRNLGYRSHLVDPDSLRPVVPGEVQLQTVVDYLAVKGEFDAPGGWRIGEPLSVDERVSRVVRECKGTSRYALGQRVYIAGNLADAEADVLGHPEVVALLADLRDDPEELVRDAAAWSSGPVGVPR